MSTPRVAVVILNWNGRSFLERFLPLVETHTPAWVDLVVVDNASDDDSVAYLRGNHERIQIIELATNLGYAGGYKAALRQLPHDYYILLNSDIEVTPGWIEPIIEWMEKDASIAACQPKILSYHQRNMFEYAGASGGYLDRYGYPFCRGRMFDTLEEDQGQYDEPTEAFWATGACLFVRATAYQKAGGLDEDFFAHMEEIDLCWRFHHAGYKVMVVPTSMVYHVGGGTLPKASPTKTYLNFRNSLWILVKNLPTRYLIRALVVRTALDKLAAFRFLLSGHWRDCLAVFRAHVALYTHFRRLRRATKSIPHDLPEMLHKRSIVVDYYLLGRRTYRQVVRRT